MCSYIAPVKTVQDITNEIMNILNMYEYPDIPFILAGVQGINLRKFEMLKEIVFDLQHQIELWYMDRKCERWQMKKSGFSQHVLLYLKLARIRKTSLFNVVGKPVLSERYYKCLLKSYITRLSNIRITLVRWLFYLFSHEKIKYGKKAIHYSLRELFCQGVKF